MDQVVRYGNRNWLRIKSNRFGDVNLLFVDEVRARGSTGLKLTDDAGDYGIFIEDGGDVGVGTATLAGRLSVDQGDVAGAIPVLVLDQADVSEEMIEFVSTIGVGNAIEAAAAKALTTTHFIKITLPGPLTCYIPAGTIA